MTTVKTYTIREVLNGALPDNLPDALRMIKFGNMLSVVKVTFASLTSAAAQDITTAAAKTAATFSGIRLASGELLPPIGEVLSLRVTAGAAAAGSRAVTDVGGTPSASLATISDSGKILTFETTVTGFVLQYIPRAAVSPDTIFAPST